MQQQQQQSDEEDCSVFTFGDSSNTGCTSVEDTSSSKGEEDVDEFLQFLYGGDGDDMSGWEDDMPWEDIDLVHYAEQAAVEAEKKAAERAARAAAVGVTVEVAMVGAERGGAERGRDGWRRRGHRRRCGWRGDVQALRCGRAALFGG